MVNRITLKEITKNEYLPYDVICELVGDALFISEGWSNGYIRTIKGNIPAIIEALKKLE